MPCKIYSLLSKHPIFLNVPKEHIEKLLCENISTKSFPPDTEAYTLEKGGRVGIILFGTARVYSGSGEENALLNTLHTGDIFGVANLYDEEQPFPSRIITVTDTEIAFIEGERFRRFIESDEVALKNYLTFLTRKIIYLNKKITTFTAGSAEKRLALFISEHQREGIFSPPCSMSELADILGIGRASLYRAVDVLKDNSVILSAEKNKFTIDVKKLKILYL